MKHLRYHHNLPFLYCTCNSCNPKSQNSCFMRYYCSIIEYDAKHNFAYSNTLSLPQYSKMYLAVLRMIPNPLHFQMISQQRLYFSRCIQSLIVDTFCLFHHKCHQEIP